MDASQLLASFVNIQINLIEQLCGTDFLMAFAKTHKLSFRAAC